VILAHAAAGLGWPLDKINRLTPQFLALFALGALAVWIGTSNRRDRLGRPLTGLAVGALAAFVLLAATLGSEWIVAKFFWMDLLFGVSVASLLALMSSGRMASVRRVLTSSALTFLGLFSYSIYLIHDPIVRILNKYLFGAMGVSPLATFGLSIAFGLPVVLAICYGFHLLFEAPFLHNRGWNALKTMPIVRLWTQRGNREERQAAQAEELHDPSVVLSRKAATGE
jgi:peptidoglycan/LPS O-acetylase OafA/YrhL